jgi:hypothetical protein
VHGLALTDTWQGNNTHNVYTHYSVSGTARINRIYATQELLTRKLGVEVIVAPFTHHLAIRMGRGLWKIDSAVLIENAYKEKLITLWGSLQRQKRYFADSTMWWDRLSKRTIRQVFQREQAER